MTAKEIRELSPAEITTKLRDARAELTLLRMKKHTGQVEKTHTIRSLRKDIARFETALNQKKSKAA
jgi:large subunit ribosomal protein L29